MEAKQSNLTENDFVAAWNATFLDHKLTAQNLSMPSFVMSALLELFNKLDIDKEAITAPPPLEEMDEHMVYYWDLVPALNCVRVVNQLLSVTNSAYRVTLLHVLAPARPATDSMLLVLFNIWRFNQERAAAVAPHEHRLFAHRDRVLGLEDKKNELLEMLNEQATDKASRAQRLEQLEESAGSVSRELAAAEEEAERARVEAAALGARALARRAELDARRQHAAGLRAHLQQARHLRVTDADDVRQQHRQVIVKEQEANATLQALREQLAHKTGSVDKLRDAKGRLDEAGALTHEIHALTDQLRSVTCAQGGGGEIGAEVCAAAGELAEAREAAARHQREGAAHAALAQQARADSARLHRLLADAQTRCEEAGRRVRDAAEQAAAVRARTDAHAHSQQRIRAQIAAVADLYRDKLRQFDAALLGLGAETARRLTLDECD